MTPGPGEPAAGPWRVVPIASLVPATRPLIIGVDGRGASGKTTLAERLGRVAAPAAVVHSDAVAWHHSRFGWDGLMADHVIGPWRAGHGVDYRPPGWEQRGREGKIHVPASATTLVIEGVGATRAALAGLLDVRIWVQSDFEAARERGLARDRELYGWTADEAVRNWDDWMVEEIPFLIEDRPWERADVVVGTSSGVPHDPETDVPVSRA